MPDKSRDLFFIAILIEGETGDRITALKKEVARDYDSRRALNSPPHITIVPPFKMDRSKLDHELVPALFQLAASMAAFEIALDGFSAFKPRVIFVNPVDNPALAKLHKEVHGLLSEKFQEINAPDRPFHAHITIAFRDLTEGSFKKAWPVFRDRQFSALSSCAEITILEHTGERWEPYIKCPIGIS